MASWKSNSRSFLFVGLFTLLVLVFFIVTFTLFAQDSGSGSQLNVGVSEQGGDLGATAPENESADRLREQGTSGNNFSPAGVVFALTKAYPEKITGLKQAEGDWAMKIDDTWFFYAQGRLLPEALRDDWESFSAHPFYPYPKKIDDYKTMTANEAERLEKLFENRLSNPLKRHPGFFDALWKAGTKAEADEQIITLPFLGKKMNVHRDLEPVLKKMETELNELKKNDKELAAFIKTINAWSAWNWRSIQGTESRSYHSYGVAIDFLPAKISSTRQYWLWARSSKAGWYLKALQNRLIPPVALVETFEKYGFLWGGKWRLFDSIHFEYRPEILLLNGFTVVS